MRFDLTRLAGIFWGIVFGGFVLAMLVIISAELKSTIAANNHVSKLKHDIAVIECVQGGFMLPDIIPAQNSIKSQCEDLINRQESPLEKFRGFAAWFGDRVAYLIN